ncbi:MAG: gamma carbonic anhydrase family protein [Pseudomonadota bacterium]
MSLYTLDGKAPQLPPGDPAPVYVAPGARVIGDVRLSAMATVWFNAVLRGDNEPIILGAGSNIQDNCVCHVDPGFPLTIGEDVTVGHSAVLHGCTIGDGSLIGMGAMVLNGAVIGKGCLIGAKALVTEGKVIPDHSMVLGAPGKVVRTLDAEAVARLRLSAESYKSKLPIYRDGLGKI